MLFCCRVGENGSNISVGDGPSDKIYFHGAFASVNEVICQKLLCVIFYKSIRKPRLRDLKHVDLVRLILFILPYKPFITQQWEARSQ